MSWTDQGIRNIKESAKRLDAGRALAKQQGCVYENIFMTMGSFDVIAVIEAPEDETLAKHVLTLGAAGNVVWASLLVPVETDRPWSRVSEPNENGWQSGARSRQLLKQRTDARPHL